MAHTQASGAPCDRHSPIADDLIGPATLGTTCFAALHDLASGLQAIGAAIDELDATAGADPRIRALVDAAIEANDKATAMFVAMRNIVRDAGRRREPVELGTLVRRGAQQATTRAAVAAVPPGEVVVAIPVVAQIVTMLIDAAAAGQPGAVVDVTVAIDGADAAIAIAGAAVAAQPASIGATLAIAARAVEAQGGTVQCGERAGRAVYTVRLPKKA